MGDMTRFWLALSICLVLPTAVGMVAIWRGIDFHQVQSSVLVVEIGLIFAAAIILLIPRKRGDR